MPAKAPKAFNSQTPALESRNREAPKGLGVSERMHQISHSSCKTAVYSWMSAARRRRPDLPQRRKRRACGENAMRPCRVIAQSSSLPRECLLVCGSFTGKIMEGRCGCPRNPHILGCKMTAYVAEVQTLHSANGIRISA